MAEHAAMSEHGNRKRLFVPGRPFHLRRFYGVPIGVAASWRKPLASRKQKICGQQWEQLASRKQCQ